VDGRVECPAAATRMVKSDECLDCRHLVSTPIDRSPEVCARLVHPSKRGFRRMTSCRVPGSTSTPSRMAHRKRPTDPCTSPYPGSRSYHLNWRSPGASSGPASARAVFSVAHDSCWLAGPASVRTPTSPEWSWGSPIDLRVHPSDPPTFGRFLPLALGSDEARSDLPVLSRIAPDSLRSIGPPCAQPQCQSARPRVTFAAIGLPPVSQGQTALAAAPRAPTRFVAARPR
jgi:hypothetical protein